MHSSILLFNVFYEISYSVPQRQQKYDRSMILQLGKKARGTLKIQKKSFGFPTLIFRSLRYPKMAFFCQPLKLLQSVVYIGQRLSNMYCRWGEKRRGQTTNKLINMQQWDHYPKLKSTLPLTLLQLTKPKLNGHTPSIADLHIYNWAFVLDIDKA